MGERQPSRSSDCSVLSGRPETIVLPRWRGPIIGRGVSGYVEFIPPDKVRKFALLGSEREESLRDINTEISIYRQLGKHPRLVPLIDYDSELGITLEFMVNGNLKDYLRKHRDDVSEMQRRKWAIEAAEGVQFLHSHNVIHSDLKPRNFLLNSKLELKIADFSGSAINGSMASASESTRFYLARDWRQPPTVKSDIFALGSTIYEIMTGKEPYEELESPEVERLYEAKDFPETSTVAFGRCIRLCWLGEITTAEEVARMLRKTESEKQIQAAGFLSLGVALVAVVWALVSFG